MDAEESRFPGNESMFDEMHVSQVQQLLELGLDLIDERLKTYRVGLMKNAEDATAAHGLRREREELNQLLEIEQTITAIHGCAGVMSDYHDVAEVQDLLEKLVLQFDELPQFLQQRMESLAGTVRTTYRAWIILAWICSAVALVLLPLLGLFIYRSIFCPFQTLLQGSRRVAAGEFDHRIKIDTQDEMQELATAMNGMTQRFQEIRDGLDMQVRMRTRQVVRSEQLASVGFLAAGVSHEINNPLQSIALCAESLEERLHDVIQADDELPDNEHNSEITVVRQYLRMIQDEAFRCKQITGQLLDFARLGESDRESTDLNSLVHEVLEMISHLGKYKNKKVQIASDETVVACVNAPKSNRSF